MLKSGILKLAVVLRRQIRTIMAGLIRARARFLAVAFGLAKMRVAAGLGRRAGVTAAVAGLVCAGVAGSVALGVASAFAAGPKHLHLEGPRKAVPGRAQL